jgi:hypothetical protein
MGYLTDKINWAAVYKRPLESDIQIVQHWGIVVQNSFGKYLVHDMPQHGVVAT